MVGLISAFLLLIVSIGHAERFNYDGYSVHQTVPSSYEHLQQFLSKVGNMGLDFWHIPRADNDMLEVMVAPEKLEEVKNVFNSLKMDAKQVVDNVESLFEQERRSVHHIRRRATPSISSYTHNFHSYTEITDFLHAVANSPSKYSGVSTSLFSIGKSTEGRDMAMMKIQRGNSGSKPAIFVDGGIHAREWIAPAVVVNFIYQLAFNPNHDRDVDTLLNSFDWYLLPLVNPDGYQYSRTRERSWRKTMSVNGNSRCKGTDANRNFGYHWNPYAGGSTDPCEEIYAGPHSFSIPESTNLASFMRQHSTSIKAYLTLHSYGQMILYPFGYSSSAVASDYRDLDSLARAAVNAMSSYYFVGSSGKDLYPAAGGSDDYAKGQCGIPYSYTVELPPRDTAGIYSGFIVDPSHIPAIAADTFKGLKAFGKELARRLH